LWELEAAIRSAIATTTRGYYGNNQGYRYGNNQGYRYRSNQGYRYGNPRIQEE